MMMGKNPRTPKADRRAVHHSVPLPHNYNAEADLVLPPIPAVDRERAVQPVSPGMPPLRHVPLPSPETLQFRVPGAPIRRALTPNHGTMPAERVRFPVAGPPPVRLSTPAPTVTTPPTAPTVQPGAASAAAAVAPSPAPPAVETVSVEPGLQIEPLVGLAFYLALGLGTLFLSIEDRYTVLWVALFLLGGAARLTTPRTPRAPLQSGGLFWGVGVGLVFSLPLLILTGRGLAETVSVLFPDYSRAALLQALIFAMPLGETLFFRGAIQGRHGFTAGVAAAAVSSLLLFWPAASGTPIYLFAGLIFSGVLAGVYSYVNSRYGLVAAYACQVTANVMLLFIPGVLLQVVSPTVL